MGFDCGRIDQLTQCRFGAVLVRGTLKKDLKNKRTFTSRMKEYSPEEIFCTHHIHLTVPCGLVLPLKQKNADHNCTDQCTEQQGPFENVAVVEIRSFQK